MKRLCGLLAAALPVLAGAGDTFLLRNVAVHTVTKGDIANGAVYVRDGKIAAVGARLNLPKGVRVIDGAGQHLWPGLIDSGTSLGLNEIRSIRESADLSEIGDYNPQLRTLVAINPASDHIPVARANGIAAAITLPEGGVLAGQAALVHLDGWTWEEMDIARAAALHLRFPVLSTRPSSRFSRETSRGTPYTDARREYRRKLQALEDFFEQARRYRKAKVANAPGFKPDVRLEAMLPVLEGTVPVLVTASRERAIRDALEFAEKEKIRIILAAAEDAARLAPELKAKNIPVILGPTFRLPREEDDPYDAPFTLPAEMHKAGVKFAFASFSNQFARNLPYQAANAVAFGLPYEEAIKAVTINPAEIWGVADRLGSIEEGKWATLIVTDGDPLETRTQIKRMFIKGRAVDLDNKHKRLYEKYLARP